MIRFLHLWWCLRFRWPHDLYRPLREGRGTKESPLTMDDLLPVMAHLGSAKEGE